MKLRFTLRRPVGAVDLSIDTDTTATVGDIARSLQRSDPTSTAVMHHPTLRVEAIDRPARTLDPRLPVTDSSLGSGQYLEVVEAPPGTSTAAAQLSVLTGPAAGRTFDLGDGVTTIGRSETCDVMIDDPLISKRHARVIVGERVELVDDASSNGLVVAGHRVARLEVTNETQVLLGDSLISVALASDAARRAAALPPGSIPFTRSPRLDPQYEGEQLEAPTPPQPQRPQRFPLITAVLPILLGLTLFAVTGEAYMLLFLLFSPLMVVGTFFEARRNARLDRIEATETFREQLAQFVAEIRRHHDVERALRHSEAPPTSAVVEAIQRLSPLLWTRRPEHESFATLRLGLGRQESRTEIEVQQQRNTFPELRDELLATVEPYRMIDNVPVVATLAECGSIGVAGPDQVRRDVTRGLLVQLLGLHSPAEVQLAVLCSDSGAREWDWLKWLPHLGGDHWPLSVPASATTSPECAALVGGLLDLVRFRTGAHGDSEAEPDTLPVVVVLVDGDAPVDRPQVVDLMEHGPAARIHILWTAPSVADIPAAARTFLDCDVVNGAATGKVIEAEHVQPVVIEPLDASTAEWVARRLSPVHDAGSRVEDESDVPSTVSFLAESGPELADEPAAVVERWTESDSLRSAVPAGVRRRSSDLRALVGRSALDPLVLDLRSQGPHALVGGTTGAGKSEFLQTWILGMATAHSPERVTFLYIDYKGGAAFADCVNLPHSVGLVTDLSPHLVQRALISLRAEVRHRERILNSRRAKDLLELERRGDPECPPSLVIIVDEFAALVQEVPEFIDGVVDVAQRGRSLGLHLILATQRPAGVIKDNLRANTNLRVALRMADADDSRDVVDTTLAATFDPELPGRAIAKTGPGRLSVFQAGYVGGWTTPGSSAAEVSIRVLDLGDTEEWTALIDADDVGGADPGPTDIQRLVGSVNAAAEMAGVEPPRRPWLPDLAATYDLSALPMARKDSELVFGVADHPDRQSQSEVAYRPDVDGNMAVFGTSGSGKSTFLRSLAVSAGLTARGGPCFVHALDYASRGLAALEPLPHVGSIISGDDSERSVRLIRMLRETIDERALRYAATNAGTIEEYRRLSGNADEPRILLLLDGLSAFRNAFESGPLARVFEQFVSVAADGRPVGVHVALAADRVGAMPPALGATVTKRLALRLADDLDESTLRVPRGGFGVDTPPGRGFLTGTEVQVAVLGGSVDVTEQAAAIRQLAASMRRAGAVAATPVERLSEYVELGSLGPAADGRPVFGVDDETLSPIGFEPTGGFLVAGPAGSGRTTTVRTILASLERARGPLHGIYVGSARSPLAQLAWHDAAVTPQEWSDLADRVTSAWEGAPPPDNSVLVLDGIGEINGSEAEYQLQDLLRACRSHNVFVIGEGETQDLTGSWPVLQAVKSARHGIVLQPDQLDGDTLFRVQFPRMSRADFPVGRGVYVRNGRAHKVQVAVTE